MHGQPLEVVADNVLVDDAHGAVQLHGLLADEARRLSDIRLRTGDRPLPRDRILRVSINGSHNRHGANLLSRDIHVRHPVLQSLERADRNAELLATFQITQRRLVQRDHDPQCFRAERRPGPIDGTLQHTERLARDANHRVLIHGDVVELHIARSTSRLRRIRDHAQPRGITFYEEERHAACIGGRAAIASRNQQIVRRWRIEHDGLTSAQPPAVTGLLGRAGDMRKIVATRSLIGCQGDLQLARGDLRQQQSGERLRSRVTEQPAAQHDSAQVGLEQEPLAHLLHHGHDVDGIAAQAAEFLRERQRQQPQVGITRPAFRGIT